MLQKTFLLFIFFIVNGQAANQFKPLKVGFVSFPPFTYLKNGKEAGTIIDKAKIIWKKANIQITRHQLLPAKRLFSALKKGTIDAWYGIEILNEHVDYTSEKIAQTTLMVWHRKDHTNFPTLNEVEKLKPYRLVLIRGYGYGGWGKNIRSEKSGYKWQEVNQHQAAIRYLLKGRADLLLNYKLPVEINATKAQLDRLKSNPVQILPIKIGISKKYPQTKELLSLLNITIREK